LPPISLKGNPNLPPVDKSTHGSNESWVNWMTRHQKGLGGAPDMLATYIKNFGTDGIVQARDFVEQWDKAVPGEGATAIRAILSLLSDPAQQRAFLGGNLPKGTPFGVPKPDPAEMLDYVMAPERQTRNNSDNAPRWVYDVETGNAGWVQPKTIQLMSSNEATDQVQADKSGRDADEIDHGLLASAVEASKRGVQVASNGNTMSDAVPDAWSNEYRDPQIAQAPAPTPPVYQPNAPRPADAADRFPNPAQRARETPEQREIRIDNQRRWASEEADSRGNPSLARRAPEEWDREPMPKIVNPIVGGKVRKPDGQGEGHFGANRGTGRTHMGVDIEAAPGAEVTSPVSGTVRGEPFDPYANSRDPKLRGKVKAVKIQTDDGHLVDVLYVDPDANLKDRNRVTAGETVLGKAADMGGLYDGPITNHVHLQVRKNGRLRDPTAFLNRQ
jgi:murein DD-endopeptidase MepM/ murein hydrolase activator NlpD